MSRRGRGLIAKGLKKRQELERKLEKEKTVVEQEVEVLNSYWEAIKSFSNPIFTLNTPGGFAYTYASGCMEIKQFIGEEKFMFRKAEFNIVTKTVLADFYHRSEYPVDGEYITVPISKAMNLLDGFDAFYKAAFDYHNDRLVEQTRKEANELEEKAHKVALKPIVDDPLFGTW